MKRLSVEAKTHREEKILREANKELERFESEIESYLEGVEEEDEDDLRVVPTNTKETSPTIHASGSSTPRTSSSSAMTGSPPCPSSPLSSSSSRVATVPSASAEAAAPSSATGSQPSGRNGSASSNGGARRSRDRDQISLESGYMSSYPGEAQRHNGAFWFTSCASTRSAYDAHFPKTFDY